MSTMPVAIAYTGHPPIGPTRNKVQAWNDSLRLDSHLRSMYVYLQRTDSICSSSVLVITMPALWHFLLPSAIPVGSFELSSGVEAGTATCKNT